MADAKRVAPAPTPRNPVRVPCGGKRYFTQKWEFMHEKLIQTGTNSPRWVPGRIIWATDVKFHMTYLLTGQFDMDLDMQSLMGADKT